MTESLSIKKILTLDKITADLVLSLQDFFTIADSLINFLQKRHNKNKSFTLTPETTLLIQTSDEVWRAKPKQIKNSAYLNTNEKEVSTQARAARIREFSDKLEHQAEYLRMCDEDYYNQDYYDLSAHLEQILAHVTTKEAAVFEDILSELQVFRIRCDHYASKNTTEALSVLQQQLATKTPTREAENETQATSPMTVDSSTDSTSAPLLIPVIPIFNRNKVHPEPVQPVQREQLTQENFRFFPSLFNKVSRITPSNATR